MQRRDLTQVYIKLSDLVSAANLTYYIGYTYHGQSQSNTNERSGSLFSIYSNVASEEDELMAERWQKGADGILIFVSRQVKLRTRARVNGSIDRFILCRCRCIARHVIPGPETGPTRHLQFLS